MHARIPRPEPKHRGLTSGFGAAPTGARPTTHSSEGTRSAAARGGVGVLVAIATTGFRGK